MPLASIQSMFDSINAVPGINEGVLTKLLADAVNSTTIQNLDLKIASVEKERNAASAAFDQPLSELRQQRQAFIDSLGVKG